MKPPSLKVYINKRPRRATPTAYLASLLAGGMLGIIVSAIAVILTNDTKPISVEECYSNEAGLTVRVLDVNIDTVTYGGWQNKRFYIWTRGSKHFLSYYEKSACLQDANGSNNDPL